MFTYCVLEDSKPVQLLDVGIDKVFPWTELYVLLFSCYFACHVNSMKTLCLLFGSLIL